MRLAEIRPQPLPERAAESEAALILADYIQAAGDLRAAALAAIEDALALVEAAEHRAAFAERHMSRGFARLPPAPQD